MRTGGRCIRVRIVDDGDEVNLQPCCLIQRRVADHEGYRVHAQSVDFRDNRLVGAVLVNRAVVLEIPVVVRTRGIAGDRCGEGHTQRSQSHVRAGHEVAHERPRGRIVLVGAHVVCGQRIVVAVDRPRDAINVRGHRRQVCSSIDAGRTGEKVEISSGPTGEIRRIADVPRPRLARVRAGVREDGVGRCDICAADPSRVVEDNAVDE